MKPTLLTIAGTRPELLKLAPVVREARKPESGILLKTCFSGQHSEILETVLGDVDVLPDIDLRGAPVGRSLSQNLGWLLDRVDSAIGTLRPEGVIVQGDTNTVVAGALAAFHNQLPCFHVEAGLRTRHSHMPFPEEMNRRLVTRLSTVHFAPTTRARAALLEEGVEPNRVELTGNTSIDALMFYASAPSLEAVRILSRTRRSTRKLLVTLHRRENADLVANVTRALRRILDAHPDVELLWILHLNGIRTVVSKELGGHPSVHLLEPQSYKTFVHLMRSSYFILSDSGGVQEEAPVLGKPVLVLRDETERPEAVEAGCSRVVGCHEQRVESHCRRLLNDRSEYESMATPQSPFGDGRASERIVAAIRAYYFPNGVARERSLSYRPEGRRSTVRPAARLESPSDPAMHSATSSSARSR